MTAALAIAAASEILRALIADALARTGASLGLAPPPVTIGPPPQRQDDATGVNLCLCQAVPNDTLRNSAGFVRNPRGDLERAPLQLDLTYLVSAHGTNIAREMALGAVVETFRRTPVLTTPGIRNALAALAGDMDPLRRALAAPGVSDGFVDLTIEPQNLGIGGTASLWMAAGSPFAPSAVYVATLVFEETASPSLPVLTGAG